MKSSQDFKLDDLSQFKTGGFGGKESPDYRSFYVGRDDVHNVMKYLLNLCSVSLVFNMYGFADDELADIIVDLIMDDHVYVQGTLDRSQAGGVHEKKILATWTDEVRASFAIGESATHQISHTKGGVIDGLIAFEGSTNWSASGEGTHVPGKRYKAQNNTLLVHINPIEVHNFTVELNEEHAVALSQQHTRR